jgi:tetratricopeptide (TPR) repeat protein
MTQRVWRSRIGAQCLSLCLVCMSWMGLGSAPALADPMRGSGDTADNADGGESLARGRALLRAGRLKEAEVALRQSAQQRGQSLEALYDLARVHFAAGDYNRARNACQPLVAKAPAAAYSNLCMAQAFLVWRRATRAAEYVDKARAAEPTLPEVYQVFGDLKRVEGDAAASEAAYRRVLQSRPNDPDAHFGLGQLYLVKQDQAAATSSFRAALAGAPDWPEALFELGRLTTGSEAVQLLQRAVATRPVWPEAKLALGQALLANGQVGQAETLFREVLKQSPNMPAAHARLGMALQVRGDLLHAEVELKRGLAGLPNDADAALTLARVYAQSDRPEDAFEAYRNASSQERTGSRALVEAGAYALSLQRNTLAQAFLEKAIDRTPMSASAQARYADALVARGDKDKAKEHYRLALTAAAQGSVDRTDVQRRLEALK